MSLVNAMGAIGVFQGFWWGIGIEKTTRNSGGYSFKKVELR